MFVYLNKLNSCKVVILCGDLNVVYVEIDLCNLKLNWGNSGFIIEERGKMMMFFVSGFFDIFCYLYLNEEGVYMWWLYMNKVWEWNIGWCIDYFIVLERIKDVI